MSAIFTEKYPKNDPIGKMLTASIRAVVGLIQECLGCRSTRSERQTSPGMALHCNELNPLSVWRWRWRVSFPSATDAKVPLPTVVFDVLGVCWSVSESKQHFLSGVEYYTAIVQHPKAPKKKFEMKNTIMGDPWKRGEGHSIWSVIWE